MKRRAFIVSAAAVNAGVLSAVAQLAPDEKGAEGDTTEGSRVLYRVVMVDPRCVKLTDNHIPVGYGELRADVMGSVNLSYEESAKLHKIMNGELTSSENVPFCGHSPAYVIFRLTKGGLPSYVSVCFLCSTWVSSRNSNLRVVADRELSGFLEKALPLPPAFANVKDLRALHDLDRKKSYLELPTL